MTKWWKLPDMIPGGQVKLKYDPVTMRLYPVSATSSTGEQWEYDPVLDCWKGIQRVGVENSWMFTNAINKAYDEAFGYDTGDETDPKPPIPLIEEIYPAERKETPEEERARMWKAVEEFSFT